jgi:hypothetical protein
VITGQTEGKAEAVIRWAFRREKRPAPAGA